MHISVANGDSQDKRVSDVGENGSQKLSRNIPTMARMLASTAAGLFKLLCASIHHGSGSG